MANSGKRHRVVVVGAGFAGFNAARELARRAGATTEIVVINSTDYFLYLPLMPQVSGGLVEPAHIRVSLVRRLRKMRFVLGTASHHRPGAEGGALDGPEGSAGQVGYDRIILTVGSVNKLLPIPGIADYAHGFRSIAEASTCTTTSSASSSWPQWRPIRRSAGPAARSSWSAGATPAPKSPRRASC